jgi:hypothetical protein
LLIPIIKDRLLVSAAAVVDKDEELRDHLNFLVQERIEASGLIVALSFGGFTILTLFENTRVLSVSW